jgi:hypothetical protein
MLPNIKSIVHLCRDLTTLSLNNCVSGGLDISELSSAPRKHAILDARSTKPLILIEAFSLLQILLLSALPISTSHYLDLHP